MYGTISPPPAPLNDLAYLARVTRRDHRAIEEALAGATLLTEATDLSGVVIEASYAAADPPLLKRLREDSTTRLVDPQSLRFTGARFLEVDAVAGLPYSPPRPITVDEFSKRRAGELARRALAFQQRVGSDLYLAPGLPLYDYDLDAPDGRMVAWSADPHGDHGPREGSDLVRGHAPVTAARPYLLLVAAAARRRSRARSKKDDSCSGWRGSVGACRRVGVRAAT